MTETPSLPRRGLARNSLFRSKSKNKTNQYRFRFLPGRSLNFQLSNLTRRLKNNHVLSMWSILYCISDHLLYYLGPLLIILALSILIGMSHTFFTIILPMMEVDREEEGASSSPSPPYYLTPQAILHQSIVVLLLTNILFNYASCVFTNQHHLGDRYQRVVRELAQVTGLNYPETKEAFENYKVEFRKKILTIGRSVREMERKELEMKHGITRHSSDTNSSNISSVNDGRFMMENNNSSNSNNSNNNEDEEENKPHNFLQTDGKEGLLSGSGGVQKRRSNHHGNNLNSNATTELNSPFANDYTKPTTIPSTSATNSPQQSAPPPTMTPRPWMLLGPHDWSYCEYSKLPKPPRSHYDHVTKSLVLNMDHYCPWMFNVVGYFNYRYFMGFLMYVFLGMTYGVYLTYQPFLKLDGKEYHLQIKRSRQLFQNTTATTAMMMMMNESHTPNSNTNNTNIKFHLSQVQHLYPNTPTPIERTPITLTFLLSFSVGIAVFGLLSFHLYLILTAQTTIEYHGNQMKKRRVESRGEVYVNPYDLGYVRNLEQVWGSFTTTSSSPRTITASPPSSYGRSKKKKTSSSNWFFSTVGVLLGRLLGIMQMIKILVYIIWKIMAPSWREAEYLPLPLHGELGRRRKLCSRYSNSNEHHHHLDLNGTSSTTASIAGDDVAMIV